MHLESIFSLPKCCPHEHAIQRLTLSKRFDIIFRLAASHARGLDRKAKLSHCLVYPAYPANFRCTFPYIFNIFIHNSIIIE